MVDVIALADQIRAEVKRLRDDRARLLDTLQSIAASDPNHRMFSTLVLSGARETIEIVTGEAFPMLTSSKPDRLTLKERELLEVIRAAIPFIDGRAAYSATMLDRMRAVTMGKK
jgi:hypothetical protein